MNDELSIINYQSSIMNYELSHINYGFRSRQLAGGHSGVIPGSFWDHSGVIPGSFQGHSGIIPASFRRHFGVISGSCQGLLCGFSAGSAPARLGDQIRRGGGGPGGV